MSVGVVAVGVQGGLDLMEKGVGLAPPVADVQPFIQITTVAHFSQAANSSANDYISQQRRLVIDQAARLETGGSQGEIPPGKNQFGQGQVEGVVEIDPMGVDMGQVEEMPLAGLTAVIPIRGRGQNDELGPIIIKKNPLDNIPHQAQIFLIDQPPNHCQQNRVPLRLGAKGL